ncbi:MAG: outer membrane protein assembly factor BamA, partial [Pseudomonadales bacterium]|nr:outer membrane protein assembly factor BamA [Pseudomonadales bacterium]
MRRIKIYFGLLLCWACTFAFSNYSFEVSDIRVQGLLRVTPGTVFNAMSLELGDIATPQTVRETIRELFKTGYFNEVSINRDGDILLVEVDERPSIVAIEISGNKAVPTEALLEGLAAEGLKEGEIFKQATLDRV